MAKPNDLGTFAAGRARRSARAVVGLVHLDIALGRDGALRRPLSGAFPSAAGQPPRTAGQREDCASGDIAARCPYHSRTMSRCAVVGLAQPGARGATRPTLRLEPRERQYLSDLPWQAWRPAVAGGIHFPGGAGKSFLSVSSAA